MKTVKTFINQKWSTLYGTLLNELMKQLPVHDLLLCAILIKMTFQFLYKAGAKMFGISCKNNSLKMSKHPIRLT
jgi:hypothetical protein